PTLGPQQTRPAWLSRALMDQRPPRSFLVQTSFLPSVLVPCTPETTGIVPTRSANTARLRVAAERPFGTAASQLPWPNFPGKKRHRADPSRVMGTIGMVKPG